MNILFFLTPKSEVAYITEDFTIRQTLDKMKEHKYSSIPILTKDGKYVGTITEGDLLWTLKDLIEKKEISLKDVMKKQDLKQEKPTDPSMTLDVKNEDVEAQIDLYLKEKTGENLNALIELMRTRRVLVPANLNDEKKPVPCLINSPKNGMFLPIYTSKKEIPESPRSEAVINMPFLATNNMVFQQDEKVSGIVINPFTQNLIFKRALVEKIEEVEKKRKEGAQPKKMQLTQEQYLLFERKQFEFGFMPKRFFAQGKQMMDDLCEKKEEYMDQFFEECYQQKRMYPYLPEDFSVMVMDLSDSLLIVRVDLPVRDMGVPSCFRVYFAWNDETQEGRYFTIERTQDPGKHLLGEFKKDWKHVDYGEAPAEGAELQRVLDIIRQPGEN